ncbi:MAG: gliding motility-associated C-terminal domain-containing protein [Bacteroidota bacterium]
MKQIQLTLLVFALTTIHIYGQSIYISTLNNELYRLNINNCQVEYLTDVNRTMFDITFHPNGNLYGITGQGIFYRIDTITGNTIPIHKFEGAYYNSLTASGDGIIYTTGTHRELWSYDVSTGTSTFHGNTGLKATGDLTFFDGELYAAITGNQIALIDIDNPENSSIVIQQDISGDIFGIVSYTADCSEINTYAITNGFSNIYQIDFEANSLNFVCGLNLEIGGGASTFEFFASAPLIVEDVETIAPLCNLNDGSISIETSGGTGQISFSLDGINFQNQNTFTDLSGGNYVVYLQDETGCILRQEIELPVLNAPEITDVLVEDPSCDFQNGEISVSATGGTGALQFSVDGINFQSGGFFPNLSVGNYQIVVRDSDGCLDNTSVDLQTTGVPSIDFYDLVHTTCGEDNGQISVDVIGGAQPYSYGINANQFQAADQFENLAAGNYLLMVQDDAGCLDSILFTIDPSAPALVLPLTPTSTSCGEANGSIVIENDGLEQQALFSIDGNEYQANNVFDQLVGGLYTVSIKDENDCISTQTVDIEASEVFEIAGLEIQKEDCGESNGSVLINLNGGTPPLDVEFEKALLIDQLFFDNLKSGMYSIAIIDQEGCTIETDVQMRSRECPIYIPNVFSPNENGSNDFFEIHTHPDFVGSFTTFRVLDRWGSLVYRLEDFTADELNWDGTRNGERLESGVYIYQLEYLSEEGKLIIRQGDVTLLH